MVSIESPLPTSVPIRIFFVFLYFCSYLVTSLYLTSIPTTSPIFSTASQLPHPNYRTHFYYLALTKINRSVRTHILLPHFILHQSPLPHPYFQLHPSYRTQMIKLIFITSRLETTIDVEVSYFSLSILPHSVL